MNTLTTKKSNNASRVDFTEDKMILFLEDGRELAVPLEWFPRLRNASLDQLKKWRLIGSGEGIHWEGLDEDISIETLMH